LSFCPGCYQQPGFINASKIPSICKIIFRGYNVVMKKIKRGRPLKDQSDARDNVLRIRLSQAERDALDEAARAENLDTSTWARATLLGLAGYAR
jgi:hypothetical protein